jgi:hypothetical protein
VKGGKKPVFFEEDFNKDYSRHVLTIDTPKGELRKVVMNGLKKQPNYTAEHFIKTPDDAEKYLSMPDDIFDFNPEHFFEMDRKIGDRGIVVMELGNNPAGTVVELLGSETFAFWSIEHRDILHELMEREKKQLMKTVETLQNYKVGPYFAMLGQEYITPPLHGRNDFFDFNVKYDKHISDLIHNGGGYVHIHCHGQIKKMLDAFIEIGADVLHPIEAPTMGDVTIKEAKDALRGKICIEGNIQIGDMYESNPDEIRKMVTEVIDVAFDDSRDLIICPTASPYVPEMSRKAFDNYTALIDTILSYKYA